MKSAAKKTIGILLALLIAFQCFVLTSCEKNLEESITLPKITIETENGGGVNSRLTYKEMTLKISDTDEQYSIEAAGQIKGRGNSSWDFCDKKSYKVKLNEKENLLGIDGKDRDWVLLANGREKSLLRNWAMFTLAEEMGMEYTVKSTFVNLTLDGEYMGVYQLCEQVEVGKNRVNIDDEWKDGDCGFLLELDSRAKSDSKRSYEYFYADGIEIPLAIKSEVLSKEQNQYIKSLIDEFTRRVISGDIDALSEIADVDSIVDMYILQDFSKNRDVGFSSFYIYRDVGGKITFGCPWDFDLALGNDTGEDRGEDYSTSDGSIVDLNYWFDVLESNPEFMKKVKEHWDEVGDIVETVIEKTLRMGYQLEDEANLNYEKWQIMGKKQLFEPFRIWTMKKYIKQVKYLCSWMEDRCEYLNTRYSDFHP